VILMEAICLLRCGEHVGLALVGEVMESQQELQQSL
jgi:hypothetical protein